MNSMSTRSPDRKTPAAQHALRSTGLGGERRHLPRRYHRRFFACVLALVLSCAVPALAARELSEQQQQQPQQKLSVESAPIRTAAPAPPPTAAPSAQPAVATLSKTRSQPQQSSALTTAASSTSTTTTATTAAATGARPAAPAESARAALGPQAGPSVSSAIGPVDAACAPVRVAVAVKAVKHSQSRAVTLRGNVTVANSGATVAAIERVGVRVCSRKAEHLRATAECDGYDVPPGGSVACRWSVELPAQPAVGGRLADWSGVFSSAELSLSGERCPSKVVDPRTGLPNGSCAAAA